MWRRSNTNTFHNNKYKSYKDIQILVYPIIIKYKSWQSQP